MRHLLLLDAASCTYLSAGEILLSTYIPVQSKNLQNSLVEYVPYTGLN